MFGAWLPAPFGEAAVVGPPVAGTFDHLVWTAAAGLGVGLLFRCRGWVRLSAVVPVAFAVVHHSVNNYVARERGEDARQWLDVLDAKAWAVPVVCLLVAVVVDLRVLHRGKRTVPGVLLATEGADGDSVAALLRYFTWSFSWRRSWRRIPWSALIVLRYVGLRRALLYAEALARPGEAEPLRGAVADATSRMDATDHQGAWRPEEIRARLAPSGRRVSWRTWLLLVPCVLMLPRCSSSGWVHSPPRPGCRISSPLAAARTF